MRLKRSHISPYKMCMILSSAALLLFAASFMMQTAADTPVGAASAGLHFERIFPFYMVFINGMVSTLELTFLSLAFGFVLGVILAVIKVSRFQLPALIARFYTSIFRGTPLLVQLFLIYFATPQITGYKIEPFTAAIIAFSLNSAAYISEIFRGGIQSVDKGQSEAAWALGVCGKDAMLDIVIPQALKTVLPSLVNECISLLKDSSLVSTIGMLDMMRAAQISMNVTYLAFEPFILIALMYYVLIMILTFVANRMERRLHKSD